MRAGHDLNYLALSGVLSLVGTQQTPVAPGIQAADIAGGALWPALRCLAALLSARQSGRGCFLDVSMTAGVSSLAVYAQAEAAATGEEPTRERGILGGEYACYGVYETSDGQHMALAALEPKFWAAFCHAVGRPEWVARQFAAGPAQQALVAEVSALFGTRTRDDWEASLAHADCCCEPVLGVQEARRRAAQEGEEWGASAPAAELADLTGGGGVRGRRAPELGDTSATDVLAQWSRT